MRLFKIVAGFLALSLVGCNIFDDSYESDHEEVFGVWQKTESVSTSHPAPHQSVTGWQFTDEIQADVSTAIGSLHPVGVESNTGEASLIESRHLPSYTPQIHEINSEEIIMDYLGFRMLTSSEIPHIENADTIQAAGDLYHTIDTVAYRVSSEKLTLDGRYYNGTYQRIALGDQVLEPSVSQFEVAIDGEPVKNLNIAETVPTAYISRLDENNIQLYSAMGGQNITIKITDFDGPGTYTIGREQAIYSRFGFDTLSPGYVASSDSSGVLTVESFDSNEGKATGSFEFTAHMETGSQESDSKKEFTNGSFELTVFN